MNDVTIVTVPPLVTRFAPAAWSGQECLVPLLLCDLDDTLADRQSIFATWAASFLADVGGDPDDASWLIELDANGYTPRAEFFAAVLERMALQESLEDFAQRYHRDYVQSFRCTAEVVAALGRARRAGFKIAIVTNGDTRVQAGKITAAGLADLVDACCISEAEGFWKPAPELFRIAAQRCDETLDDAWMIGDNPVADIGGAGALGVWTAWICLARPWPDELDYRPTLQVERLREAVDSILQLTR